MSKAPLYSRSRRHPAAAAVPPAEPGAAAPGTGASQAGATPAAAPAAQPATRRARLQAWAGRHQVLLSGLSGALLASLVLMVGLGIRPGHRVITQDDIDQAVRAS
ncbi:MAG: hypothetical protein RJA10_2056, partial [Pseudomonadota bacterium]